MNGVSHMAIPFGKQDAPPCLLRMVNLKHPYGVSCWFVFVDFGVAES